MQKGGEGGGRLEGQGSKSKEGKGSGGGDSANSAEDGV